MHFPLRFADGRSSSTVQVQLFCLWEARNFRRGGVLMGVDMLLLDSQVSSLTPSIVHKQIYFTGLML
ncbi:hypothetical protein HID58_015823 [Brassica napus]|uniref:Uncharacterized protein n=1 Tax=Brassica napus TaxID=3708 RepID=A0ABQ8DNS1_BRANA|nr:hypothetical protein HID58_015823 [Brassica napus]